MRAEITFFDGGSNDDRPRLAHGRNRVSIRATCGRDGLTASTWTWRRDIGSIGGDDGFGQGHRSAGVAVEKVIVNGIIRVKFVVTPVRPLRVLGSDVGTSARHDDDFNSMCSASDEKRKKDGINHEDGVLDHQ